MDDNVKLLYDELKDTYELGSEDDFRNYLSNGDNREALRKELESEYEVGDSASFSKYLGFGEESGEEKPAAESATQTPAAAETPAPSPEAVPGSDEWRALGVASPGNPYNGKTYGEVYDSVIQDYGRNLANPDIDPYAEARAQIMQAGITDDMKPEQADKLALDIREGYANRYASNGAKEMVAALPDQVPNIDDLMDSQWYSRELQGRISHEAARLGLRRENYVNYYVKPHIAKALSDRYGYDANSASHIANRLLSQEDHTADQIRRREAVGIIAANAGDRINEQFQKIQQAADEQTRAEAEGSMMTPFGSAGQSMGAAFRNWQASDPEAVWQKVKPFFDDMGSWLGIVGNQQLFEQISQMAESENIPVNTYIDQYVLPAYADTVKREFERIAVEREMPKNTFDYVMDKVGQSLVGTVGRWLVESKARMRAQDEALQMTDTGQNQDYTPGYGARIAGGTAEMMSDMLLPFGGPFGLATKAATKPLQGMTQALITSGWGPLKSRINESIARGAVSLGAFEGLKGAFKGAFDPEGYESVLAEDKRSASEILTDMLKGAWEGAVPSAVAGATMIGHPIANKAVNGRGILANALGWGAGSAIDAAGATVLGAFPRLMAGKEVSLSDEFADNFGQFLALGLHSKAKEFASLANGGRSWNGVEFTKDEIKFLEDRYLWPLRQQIAEIEQAQSKKGLIERTALGLDAKESQRQAINSEGAKIYNDIMNSYGVPRELKVKVAQALNEPIPESAMKPEVLESTDKALTQSVDLGWQELANYEYNRPGGVAAKVKAGEPLTDYELTLRLLYQDNKQWNEVVQKVLAGEEISADEARLLAAYNERIGIIQRDYYQREKERLTAEFERENGLKKGTIARMLEDVREGCAVEDPETLDKFNDMMREFGESLDKFKTARDEAVNTGQDQETPAEEAPNINKVPEETATKTDEVTAEETPTRIDFRLNDEVTVADDDGTITNGFVATVPAVSDGTFAIQTDDGRVIYRNAEYMQTHVTSHNGTEITANIPKPKPEPETPAKEEAQADGGIAAKYRIPLDKDGNPDYERATPEDSYDAMMEEFGEDYAAALINSEISDAQKRIPKPVPAESIKIPNGLTMAEKARYVKQEMERQKNQQEADRQATEKEQARIDYWKSVLEVPKTRKAEADRAARREKMQTPEGRAELLSEAKNAQERAAVAKEIYGDYFNENTGEPDTVEELVSMLLPYGKLNWEGYERGINHVRGLQEELGSQHTRGLSKDKGTAGFNSYLAKKGEGESLDDIVHSMYEDSVNLAGDEHRFTTEEIKDAVIDMILSAEKSSDIRDYILNSRIATAEKTLRAELEHEAEVAAEAEAEGVAAETAANPIGPTSTPEQITLEEGKVNTDPTDGQKEAGNYQKGHVRIDGYDITIENPKGSVRRGTDASGKQWEQKMSNTYGYIRGTEGVDGDHIDVFLSDSPAEGKVFVIDQVSPETGEFDEHKVMYGFADAAEAVKAYLSNYEQGWKGLGAVTGISREAFKEWVQSSHRKTKPFREYAIARSKGETEDGKLPFGAPTGEDAPFHTVSPEDRPVEDAGIEKALMNEVMKEPAGKGVEFITDVEEGQRVIDEYNGTQELKPMGQKTNKKKAQIADDLEGKELTPEQQAVVDVYSGKKDNQSFVVSRDDGDHRIIMRQGNESHAGTKHSLYRHYGTNVGTVSSDELLLIPEIAGNGELTPKQDGKRRLMVYKSVKDGVEYTLLTEKKEGKEVFNDFYSNKKASSPASFNTPEGARSTRDDASNESSSPLASNTPEGAHSFGDDVSSGAKVRQNPETAKDSERKMFKTPDGHAYGFTYKGKIYIDPRIATAETPIHEYGHLWAEMKRQTSPEEWDRIKEVLMRDEIVKPFIEKVMREYPELTGEGKEDAFVEEVLTQFSGRHGAEKLRKMAEEIKNDLGGDATAETIAQAAIRKVKGILNDFWKGVADMMGWHYTTAEDIADAVLRDLLNGVNPVEKIKTEKVEMKPLKEDTAARDKEYADAVAAGDAEKVDAMLREEAARKGYSEDSSYQGSIAFNGAAPSRNGYFETREERKEAMENGTFEDTFSLGDYAEAGIDANDLEWQLANPRAASAGDQATLESIRNLNAAIKGKTGKVKMYRAVDAAVKENSFRNGDWITPSRRYAEQHIELQDWKKGRIIEEEVPVDDIWWNGDDINEWGYDDGKGYVYKNTRNNRKLMEPTYDDKGNLIPLSQRFNDRKADILFQKKSEKIPYTLSEEKKDAEGNRMYEREGSIDLWSATPLLAKAGRQQAPVRLSERNMKHIIDRHSDRLDTEDKVFEFLDNVFDNAKILRRAKGRGMFVVFENKSNDSIAMIKLMPSEDGDYYNIDTAGFYRKNKWKESEEVIADLSEPDRSDAAADASKPQVPDENGGELINAEAQLPSSGGKVTKNNDTLQEKTEKSSDEAPKFSKAGSPEPEKADINSIMEEVERRKDAPKFQKAGDGRDPVTRILDEADDRRETARLQKAPLSEEDDIARKVYEDAVAKSTLKFQEAWQDSMVSLKKLQEAIEAETGNRAAGAEDAYAFENRMHGRAKNMGERFDTQHYQPMLRAFDELTKDRGWDNGRTMDYLISKHGLERNGYYAFRDAVREKLHDAIEEEKKKLDSDYSKKKVDEAYYAGMRAELEERERNVKAEAEEAIAGFRDTLAYKRAKEDYENGTIGYSEYLRRLEDLMRAFSTREKPRKDGDGRVVSTNYYDDHARDYSGLTETFAKEMYDEAQKTKRMAQRTVDPDRKKELWKEYDAKMRQAYITARQTAEDAVFSGEKQDVPTPLKDTAAGRLWDRINDATKETLRISYESGMMDRSTYNKVRDMFDYYIPLRGWDENKASDVYSYIGKENVFSPAVKKTWGRTSKAENPLAYIGNIATSTILSGQRNLMKQHFLNYVMNNPTSLTSVSESWYENVGTKENPVWELRTADTAGKSADEIASIVSDFNQEMAEKQANGMAMPVRGRLRMDLNATKGQKAEHVVEVQRNGHTYQIYINGDPKAAQALNGTAAKAVSRISDTYVGKKLGELNRSMAAFFTSKNPAFVVSNLSRDLNMAGASVAVNEGAEYNARFVKNVAKVLTPRMGESSSWVKASRQPTGMMPDLMRKYKKGTLDEGDDTERYFKEFMDEGGETGFVNMLSVDSFKEKMQDEIGHMQGSNLFGRGGKECSVRKGLRLMGDTFEFYNRCAEDATRFIVYMTSRETGKTMEESIADAKDVTLNFNRKGTGGKGNAEMRDLFIFVNPAIQALANMYRMGKGHPLKLGAVATSFMAGGAFMPVLNQWLLNMFGDDDDKQAYWNLPPWVRKNNLVMWIPGTRNFLTIPLAQEFRVFYGTGETISSAVMDHPTENMGLEVASSVADLVPINPTGNGGNLLVDFMPTGVQPLVQVGENVDFTGRPIWKENEGNKLDPMYTKAYAGTPKWMVKVSEKLNDWTGGNVGRKGVVEEKAPVWGEYINNPAVWNHLLQGYLGGMYNTIAKAFDTAYTLVKGELPDVYQVPVLNRFVNRPSERENAGLLGEEYWDLVRERDVLMNELGKNAQAAADGDAEAQKRVDEIMASDDFKRAQVIGHYKKIMDDLRKGEKAAGQTEPESGARDMIRQSIGLYKQQMEDELKAVGGGTDPLEQAYKEFDAAATFTERNRFRQKIKDLSSRPKARKPADEAVEKALRYTKDEEDESREGSEKYLMEATSDDLRSDAEISLLKRQAKDAGDEATYKDLDNLQKKLGRWKNKLGEESRDYGTYSMQLIREHRQEGIDGARKALEKPVEAPKDQP